MNYMSFVNEQDIIMMRNIMYKDCHRIDSSVNGHPVIVVGVTEEYFYYLTMSSSKSFNAKEYQHFTLVKNSKNRLKRNISYVNLKNIYKEPIKSFKPLGHISDQDFHNLMQSLKYYQENLSTDNLYLEIKDIVDSYTEVPVIEKPLIRSLKK